jgi:L-rhamnonate dehydratase
MKITDIRLRQLTGTMRFDGDFWEERLIRPIDVYPEHQVDPPPYLPGNSDNGEYTIKAIYMHIDTDEGVSGIGGPITDDVAYFVDRQLRPILIGENPLAIERLWDKMYRFLVHGRKGPPMLAISAVDCTLWDLKGRYYNAPVYELLGGPIRTEFPAYASMLGYSLDDEKVFERAGQVAQQGYTATKWFPRWGPNDGKEGIEKNVRLAQTLREAIGPDVDFMLDAWMSWSAPYTETIANRIVHLEPRWIEEPVMPDLIDVYAETRARSVVPISGGEHEYTRFGLKELMDAGAVDVLQPDVYWCGGISETMKIIAIASTYNLPVIPHGHSVPAVAHVNAAVPALASPLQEYLVKWNEIHQFFWKDPVKPVNGMISVPTGPGMGMEFDPDKIQDERPVSFEI